MVKLTYDKQLTGLLVIDPYNDFTSLEGFEARVERSNSRASAANIDPEGVHR